jgi:uncharacterized membrane protein
MWETKYRLRFRFRSFPLVIVYGLISIVLCITIVGIFFLTPLWAHYIINNIEIEEVSQPESVIT